MSNGSIIELVAKGMADEDLIDINNNSSLFNYDIKKKNKYTKGDVFFYPQGNNNWGNTLRFNIEREGDLLYGLYVKITLPKLSINNLIRPPNWVASDFNETNASSKYRVMYTDYVGNVIIEKASLYINGILIDELYGDYMQVYTDLYISDCNRKEMLGLDDILNKPNLKIDSESIYVPLKFWFCIDQLKPLPLIALQNSEIYIDIKLRNFHECISVLEKLDDKLYHSDIKHNIVSLEEISLLGCFYYVDLEERAKLATSEYEILITQTQLRSQEISTNSIMEIDFNNIVKDLFFFIQPLKHIKYGEFFNWSSKMKYIPVELFNVEELKKLDTHAQLMDDLSCHDSIRHNINNDIKLWELEPSRHLLVKARMLFNGIERIQWRDYKYFYFMQNHENYQKSLDSYIYMYSFNINPTRDANYSGCNFSRLSNSQLQIVTKTNTFYINETTNYPTYDQFIFKCYATNYNILVINNGICGIKYSN